LRSRESVRPSSFVYQREARRLLSFERDAARRSAACVFVTEPEAELFGRLAPECRGRLHVIEMGVNTDYFAPHVERVSPFEAGEVPIVFTGAMDYWPNIDAVTWFALEVMPQIVSARPDARFYIVGMNPAPAVETLGSRPEVVVTGTVHDVRPYLQHAAAVVAPLRVARGMQSKVLEAMAMARPVVVSPAASTGVRGESGDEFEIAESPEEFARKVLVVLERGCDKEMGRRARARIVSDYSWDRNLAQFDRLLDGDQQSATSCMVH
jgi:sugar transferase (PEP-CTERM/EpsH1 system associated)